MYLENLQLPEDLKKLNNAERSALCDEIREFLIRHVAKTGGHLAANLGVVELTVALHLTFDVYKDQLIWDVGHQSYVHKILTGRAEQFDTLRQFGGCLLYTSIGNAFRNDEAYSTVRQREFTQVGVELFGDNSVEADAEVIEIAIETIAKAGVQHFQIDIGQVEYFKGLANQAEFDEEDADKIRSFINEKDFIGLEKTLDSLCLDGELKEIFMHLPTMFGGIEVVKKALSYQKINTASKAALDNLMQVYRLLEEKGLSDLISIDLGTVSYTHLDVYKRQV